MKDDRKARAKELSRLRQARLRERRRAQGMVFDSYWATPEQHQQIKELLRKDNDKNRQ